MDGKKPINKYNNGGTRTSKSVGCHEPTSKPIVGTVSIYATFCAPLELGHRRGASVLANVATSINDPNLGKRWVTCDERTFGVPLQHVIMIIIDFFCCFVWCGRSDKNSCCPAGVTWTMTSSKMSTSAQKHESHSGIGCCQRKRKGVVFESRV